MNTERWLQVCISSMAALATVMLGTSQDNTTLAVIALAVAVGSLVLTDFLGWFYLHRYIAGAAGVIAGLNAFVQSQTGGLDTQFISVANLLIHLQIILLFQKKSLRIYWQLITLSLLQVVVAAALNLFVLFGPLLIAYTICAISALLVFFIQRETYPFLGNQRQAISNADKTIRIDYAESLAAAPQKKPPRRVLLKLSYPRHFLLLAISTVTVSAGVFLLMPRFGDGVWRAKTSSAKTGFSGEVDLEDVGTIYESPTIVMRIGFVDSTTMEPYRISGFPFFRGGVLEDYSRGKWVRYRGRELNESTNLDPLDQPQRIYSAVRQKVNLESKRDNTVFTVAPPCALGDTSESMRISRRTLEVRYFYENDEDPAEYSIGTTGFRNGLQSQFVPMLRPVDVRRESNRQFQVQRFLPALAAKAEEIVANIPEDRVLARARSMEQFFTDGREGFKYSLDPSPDRDPNVDPVQDFVLNHKSGHCQFFASGLALMLRSQGIASRVVIGYRADTFNAVGNYYQLREMDAHAWVEAAIPADQIPADEVLPAEGLSDYGAWVRLDPTPSSDSVANSATISPWRQKLGDTIDYMQLLWSEYVLGLNEKRQRRAIYEPIRNAFRNVAEMTFSRATWAARWEAIQSRLEGGVFTRQNVRDSLIAIALLTATFYALRLIGRQVWRYWMSLWRHGNRRVGPQIDFYRRFESMLAKQGLRRSVNQTHRDFAGKVQTHLQDLLDNPEVAKLPSKVVDDFYRVRFGGQRLDNSEVQRLENWLGTLQQSLAHRPQVIVKQT